MGVAAPHTALPGNSRLVVGVFRKCRALTGATAKSLLELRLNLSPTLRSLIDAGVVRRAGPHRYFLNEEKWARRRQLSGATLRWLAVPAVIALVAALVYGFVR